MGRPITGFHARGHFDVPREFGAEAKDQIVALPRLNLRGVRLYVLAHVEHAVRMVVARPVDGVYALDMPSIECDPKAQPHIRAAWVRGGPQQTGQARAARKPLADFPKEEVCGSGLRRNRDEFDLGVT